MTILPFLFIFLGLYSTPTRADCRHPNGDLQTDAYHAPCASILNNPLNTMCCAIDRPNPSEGYQKDDITADVCLPNGLCKQVSREDDTTPLKPVYFREECTVADWKSGKCLSVCLTNSVSRNVMMTPCDGTANSTKWCCGDNVECCTGEIGVETLAQTFMGMLATTTLPSSTVSSSISIPSTSGTASVDPETSPALSGGAIAGIVIGALVGAALLVATLFFVARHRRSTGTEDDMHVEEVAPGKMPKAFHAHQADVGERQVSEVSAAHVGEIDGRTRLYEM